MNANHLAGSLRVVAKDEIPALLPMTECIELIDRCMRQVSMGNVELPLRWGLRVSERDVMGMMPGALGEPACHGIKLVSLFPGNTARGLSSLSGLMVLFESDCGQPLAVMDAGYLTALRTAAASAVATRILARKDAQRVAILGTGEQALLHAHGMAAVTAEPRFVVWGRDGGNSHRLAERIESELGCQADISSRADEAVAEADIVCTVTAASEPVLSGEWLPAGCHVNAVGASFPEKREIDRAAVLRSRYFTDYRASCLAQAGDLREAIESGAVSDSHLLAEIGEVLLGRAQGRKSAQDITLYRSLGVAAQDLAAAWHILRRAETAGVGTLAAL